MELKTGAFEVENPSLGVVETRNEKPADDIKLTELAKNPASEDGQAALKVIQAAREHGITLRMDHIEMMAAAYYQKTNVDPEKVELVEDMRIKDDGTYEIVWYFQERKINRRRRRY
jgi:hypothetical protein